MHDNYQPLDLMKYLKSKMQAEILTGLESLLQKFLRDTTKS